MKIFTALICLIFLSLSVTCVAEGPQYKDLVGTWSSPKTEYLKGTYAAADFVFQADGKCTYSGKFFLSAENPKPSAITSLGKCKLKDNVIYLLPDNMAEFVSDEASEKEASTTFEVKAFAGNSMALKGEHYLYKFQRK